MTPIGELLSSTRERRGASLADVERATKIRAKYIEAMENEAFDKLPGDAYSVGFLKDYGEYLGLDTGELIREYRSTHESPRLTMPQPVMAAKHETRPLPRALVMVLLAAAAIALAVWLGRNLVTAMRVPSKSVKSQPQAAVKVVKPAPKPVEKKGVPRPVPFTLQVLATDHGNWIGVKVDGRAVFDGEMEPGLRKVWRVKKRIVLSSTTPELFRVYRDGRLYGVLGTGTGPVKKSYVPRKR